MRDVISLVDAARKVGTPLIQIRTPDQSQTVRALYRQFSQRDPVLRWDLAKGLVGLNDEGRAVRDTFSVDQSNTINPAEMLTTMADNFPQDTLLIMVNYQMIFKSDGAIQATWNLRDAYKADGRTLVMLTTSVNMPDVLANDVIVLDEELPDDEALEEITRRVVQSMQDQVADFKGLDDSQVKKAVDCVIGLPAFLAEQDIAMCMSPQGLDYEELTERKCQMIESVSGLSVARSGLTFSDVAGCQNVISYLRRMAKQGNANCVLWIDEVDKGVAAYNTDTSGVAQDQMGTLLTWTQKRKVRGTLFIGPPGSGKSLVAQAFGGEAGIPTIQMDLGAMKGSLVGESEGKVRQALATVDAISRGRCFVIATCNSRRNLPPEFLRRFRRGIFAFGLPDKIESQALWNLFGEKNSMDVSDLSSFDHADWTGAEIESCCDIAQDLDCSLADAAKYIVPVAKSSAEQIKALYDEANGRYISASYSGLFKAQRSEDPTLTPKRQMRT